MTHWTNAYSRIRFVDGGRDHAGVDCWGMVRLIYREKLGIELPTYGAISAHELEQIARQIDKDTNDPSTWVPIEGEPREFDVCFMTWFARKEAGHAGVMLDSTRVFHTEQHTGPLIMPTSHPFVRRRVLFYRRHRKMA